MKVQYLDEEWTAPKYDAWVSVKDTIDIPHCFVQYTPEQGAFFFSSSLQILIKDNLHVQRKVDTVVKIELPIQRSLFEKLRVLRKSKRKSHFVINSLSDFDCFFGEGWHRRGCNKERDFAHIEPGILTYWMLERRPLEEFPSEGFKRLQHRGFRFHLQFARGIGNKFDLQKFFDNSEQ